MKPEELIPGRLYSVIPEERILEKDKRQYWQHMMLMKNNWACYISTTNGVSASAGLPGSEHPGDRVVMYLGIPSEPKRKSKKWQNNVLEPKLRFAKVLYKEHILLISAAALEEIL